MAGRKTKLTPAVMDQITLAVRAGATLRIASDHLGIPLKTVLGWLRLGQLARECERRRCHDEHHGPKGGAVSYAIFAEAVQKADGDASLRAVTTWTSAFARDPYLALRWLAKHHPDDYGARAELPKASSDAGVPPLVITVQTSNAPPPEPPEIGQRSSEAVDDEEGVDEDDDDGDE